MADLKDLRTSSQYRYRATASQRKQYGGATVTHFLVWEKEHIDDPVKWAKIIGYGKTPSERALDAKKRYLAGERNSW